ncbi:MAG: DEAD/DEAH box helicase [Candidatus Magasanikbacteria bacterium]
MTNTATAQARFSELGIATNFLGLLQSKGYTSPTPIQHQVIPIALEGKDVIGIAQTGTGKTLAFAIPLIQRLGIHKGRGLILVPTRELALQVDEVFQKVGKPLGLKTAVVIGGAPSHIQVKQLRENPHVVIATPGRLIDHIQEKKFSLEKINMVVLDEADRMLDIGFMPQIKQILTLVPKQRQTMLFSATMPSEIAAIAARFMAMPLRIEVAPAGTPAEHIEQEVFIARKDEKMQLLDKLLSQYPGTVLLFSRTKHGAKKITRAIAAMGHTAAEIHSNRSLGQRKAALEGFKTGKFRVLVATDIAARGIDVTGISLVINFDLPDNSEDYVHRIGRTGRAGKGGKAISFAAPDERVDIKKIERLIKKTLPIMQIPVLPAKRPAIVVPRDIVNNNFRSHRPNSAHRGHARNPRRSDSRRFR